ncbi:unnamed protein product [Orchesella dallaii]|uniref:Glycine--tRNA ligase n=1 Tax=Orchesella dallaii TaxID=48710 RepID=A0ABP1RSX8_9HEXA
MWLRRVNSVVVEKVVFFKKNHCIASGIIRGLISSPPHSTAYSSKVSSSSSASLSNFLNLRNSCCCQDLKNLSLFSTSSGFLSSTPDRKVKGLPENWGSKKERSRKPVKIGIEMATDEKIEEILAPLRAAVKEQGDLVRKMKEMGNSEIDVKKAVVELKAKKKLLEDRELELSKTEEVFDRPRMEDLLKRRFFYDQSFAIYGGVTGQYDFGPMGCATKTNFLNFWRQFFVLEEGMFEVDCSILTPEPVLKASGHVDRFADLMVKDSKTGECFRLDHLIKATVEKLQKEKGTDKDKQDRMLQVLAQLDGYSKEEMEGLIQEFNVVSPTTGNPVGPPMEFNLMFSTSIGPTGLVKGFLRPETAQGIFVNFKRLLEFNQGKLPFAGAQIGNAFRNEISPRSGLLRVREFTMAEIEHFCDPNDLTHPRFVEVKDTIMTYYSACDQMEGKRPTRKTIGEAVADKLVANETLGYFLARIQMFLEKVGVNPEKLRFRQHMSNEMAHYARDCWDAEILTSYGWVECVGCADRSAFDLNQHTKATNVKLVAEKRLPAPKKIEQLQATLNKAAIGKQFKQNAKAIAEYFEHIDTSELESLAKSLESDGSMEITVKNQQFKLTPAEITIGKQEKTIHVEEFVPNVIEPSFGVGRILYSIFEHNFKVRPEDSQRTYFSLPPLMAPVKCSVLPLSSKPELLQMVTRVTQELRKREISFRVDDSSGSIGRRYSRTDEIAIPFGITIDFETVKSETVTLRERDTTLQVRLPIDKVGETVRDLATGTLTWTKAMEIFPKFDSQDAS